MLLSFSWQVISTFQLPPNSCSTGSAYQPRPACVVRWVAHHPPPQQTYFWQTRVTFSPQLSLCKAHPSKVSFHGFFCRRSDNVRGSACTWGWGIRGNPIPGFWRELTMLDLHFFSASRSSITPINRAQTFCLSRTAFIHRLFKEKNINLQCNGNWVATEWQCLTAHDAMWCYSTAR